MVELAEEGVAKEEDNDVDGIEDVVEGDLWAAQTSSSRFLTILPPGRIQVSIVCPIWPHLGLVHVGLPKRAA